MRLVWILLLTPLLGVAQSRPVRETSPESIVNLQQRVIIGKNLNLPVLTSVPSVAPSAQNNGVDSAGAIYYVKSDIGLWYYTGGTNYQRVRTQSGSVLIGAGNAVGWTTDSLTLRSAGILQISGTGQLGLPAGTTAQRLSGSPGDFRYNADLVQPEWYGAGAWHPLLTLSRPTTPFGYATALNFGDLNGTDYLSKQMTQDLVNAVPLPVFDATFLNQPGSSTAPIGLDTVLTYRTQTQAALTSTQIYTKIHADSVVLSTIIAGGVTLTRASSYGQQLISLVSGTNYKYRAIAPGTNVSFALQGDSLIYLNASPGTAEVNAKDTVFTTTTATLPWTGDNVITFIMVKPTTSLTAFEVGTAGSATAYVDPIPCPAAQWTVVQVNSYIDVTSTLYLAGMATGTEVIVLKTPIHR